MKKTIFIAQIILLCFFLAKFVAQGEVMKKSEGTSANPGIAKSFPAAMPGQNAVGKANNPVGDDNSAKSRDLLTAIEAKRVELEKKEQFLNSEEKRLLSLKKEIVEKIDMLRVQEEKSLAAAETQNTAESKRFKDLAKVFEATPPAKAGVMLEQLDVKTAAGITMNMKKEKAGAIWGYLSPQKAVKITAEITNLGKQETK
jgi:flagellar motility protein MotE (MotC chaperone)